MGAAWASVWDRARRGSGVGEGDGVGVGTALTVKATEVVSHSGVGSQTSIVAVHEPASVAVPVNVPSALSGDARRQGAAGDRVGQQVGIGVGRRQGRERVTDRHSLAVFVRSAVNAGALFGSGSIVKLRVVVSQARSESHTSTVTVNGPSSVGVPVKVPSGLSAHAGRQRAARQART